MRWAKQPSSGKGDPTQTASVLKEGIRVNVAKVALSAPFQFKHMVFLSTLELHLLRLGVLAGDAHIQFRTAGLDCSSKEEANYASYFARKRC